MRVPEGLGLFVYVGGAAYTPLALSKVTARPGVDTMFGLVLAWLPAFALVLTGGVLVFSHRRSKGVLALYILAGIGSAFMNILNIALLIQYSHEIPTPFYWLIAIDLGVALTAPALWPKTPAGSAE